MRRSNCSAPIPPREHHFCWLPWSSYHFFLPYPVSAAPFFHFIFQFQVFWNITILMNNFVMSLVWFEWRHVSIVDHQLYKMLDGLIHFNKSKK